MACKGFTKKGIPCKYKAVYSGYCNLHSTSPSVQKCTEITKKGVPCSRNAKEGTLFCGLHSVPRAGEYRAPPSEAPSGADSGRPDPDENIRICIAKMKFGNPCYRKAKPNSPYCAMHAPKPAKPKPETPPRSMCSGTTKKGRPCNRYSVPGTPYCQQHSYFGFRGSDNYSYNYYSYSNDAKDYFYRNAYGGTYDREYKPKPSYAPPPQPSLFTDVKEALRYFNLPENTTYTDIKKKYRELALRHHPDKGGDLEVFKKIQNYYSTLSTKYKI